MSHKNKLKEELKNSKKDKLYAGRNWKTSKENEDAQKNRGRLARLFYIDLIGFDENPKDNT